MNKTLYIVHQNKTPRFFHCIHFAKLACQKAGYKLIVITDEECVEQLSPLGVTTELISEYGKYTIKHNYIHDSMHPEWYELISINRWLIIYESMLKNDLSDCMTIDTDVLILSENYFSIFDSNNFDFISPRHNQSLISPGTTKLNLKSLKIFKRTVDKFYESERLNRIYSDKIKMKSKDKNISDMNIWGDIFSNNIIPIQHDLKSHAFEKTIQLHTSLVHYAPVEFKYDNNIWTYNDTDIEVLYLHCAGPLKHHITTIADFINSKQNFRIEQQGLTPKDHKNFIVKIL